MDFLSTFLPIIIYLLLICLLIVGIILGLRLIRTLNRVDKVVDDVNNKVKTLDSFFSIVDFTTDKISAMSDWVVEALSSLFTRTFRRRKRKKIEENLESEDEEE